MKKEFTAALLSALVYPGAGHIYVKKYPIALGFICAFSYLLISMIRSLNEVVQEVMSKINAGEVSLSIGAMSQAIKELLAEQHHQYDLVGLAMLLLWIFATLDAYRLAKNNTPLNV
jgi:hypothetical protein